MFDFGSMPSKNRAEIRSKVHVHNLYDYLASAESMPECRNRKVPKQYIMSDKFQYRNQYFEININSGSSPNAR